jgi:hypothetical protein
VGEEVVNGIGLAGSNAAQAGTGFDGCITAFVAADLGHTDSLKLNGGADLVDTGGYHDPAAPDNGSSRFLISEAGYYRFGIRGNSDDIDVENAEGGVALAEGDPGYGGALWAERWDGNPDDDIEAVQLESILIAGVADTTAAVAPVCVVFKCNAGDYLRFRCALSGTGDMLVKGSAVLERVQAAGPQGAKGETGDTAIYDRWRMLVELNNGAGPDPGIAACLVKWPDPAPDFAELSPTMHQGGIVRSNGATTDIRVKVTEISDEASGRTYQLVSEDNATRVAVWSLDGSAYWIGTLAGAVGWGAGAFLEFVETESLGEWDLSDTTKLKPPEGLFSYSIHAALWRDE